MEAKTLEELVDYLRVQQATWNKLASEEKGKKRRKAEGYADGLYHTIECLEKLISRSH